MASHKAAFGKSSAPRSSRNGDNVTHHPSKRKPRPEDNPSPDRRPAKRSKHLPSHFGTEEDEDEDSDRIRGNSDDESKYFDLAFNAAPAHDGCCQADEDPRNEQPDTDEHTDDEERDADEDSEDETRYSREQIRTKFVKLNRDIKESHKAGKWNVNERFTSAGMLAHAARFLHRIHPAYNITNLILVGIPLLNARNTQVPALCKHYGIPLKVGQAHIQLLDLWLGQFARWMRKYCALYVGCEDELQPLAGFIRFHAREGRAADLNSIKRGLPRLLKRKITLSTGVVLKPPKAQNISIADGRRRLGFHHLYTARLLCPLNNLAQFDQDPEMLFCSAVRDNEWIITEEDLPSFLFAGEDLSARSILSQLCRNSLLLNTYRMLYTGPSSVDTAPGARKGGRPSITDIYDLGKEVPPYLIATTACLLRWGLSDAPSWIPVVD